MESAPQTLSLSYHLHIFKKGYMQKYSAKGTLSLQMSLIAITLKLTTLSANSNTVIVIMIQGFTGIKVLIYKSHYNYISK